MKFWIFMLVMNLLVPLTMIGFGKLFLKCTPGKINALYGYRTSMSMKNEETWVFAHLYAGKLWYRWGRILLPVTVLAMLPVFGKDTDTVGTWGGILCLIECIPLIGVIPPTERALRKNFDKNGKPKPPVKS